MIDQNNTIPPVIETTPTLPIAPPPRSSNIWPMLIGMTFVFVLATVLGGTYYLSKLKKEISQTPSPTPTATPTLEPSPSASPSPSLKASVKPSAKASAKPVTPTIAPTPTPTVSLPSLDIRFGNPSANIKQTIDEGAGDGRVINREYTSIQIGEFDEVKTAYSPKVQVCFHVVSNEEIQGSKLGYTMTLDDKISTEGTLSQYDKLEAGRLYDFCHDLTTDLGTHIVKLNINNAKSLSESNFNNNIARLEYKNLADNVAPNFSLSNVYTKDNKSCVMPAYISDNVTSTTSLVIESKLDSGSWTKDYPTEFCLAGPTGESHTLSYRITDSRGNATTLTKTYNLF